MKINSEFELQQVEKIVSKVLSAEIPSEIE